MKLLKLAVLASLWSFSCVFSSPVLAVLTPGAGGLLASGVALGVGKVSSNQRNQALGDASEKGRSMVAYTTGRFRKNVKGGPGGAFRGLTGRFSLVDWDNMVNRPKRYGKEIKEMKQLSEKEELEKDLRHANAPPVRVRPATR